MPFTLAHPAAVLPLLRPARRFAAPLGLVVGAVVPDAPYFLPLGLARRVSHSLTGAIVVDLPLALSLCAVASLLLAPAALWLAPPPLKARLPARWALGLGPSASLASLLVGAAIGIATHLAWDAFTHGDGLAVRILPGLGALIVTVRGYPLTVFRLLQHGSTVVGCAALFAAAAWALGRDDALATLRALLRPPWRWRWVGILALPMAASLVAASGWDLLGGPGTLALGLRAAVVAGARVLLLSLALLGAIVRRPPQRPGEGGAGG